MPAPGGKFEDSFSGVDGAVTASDTAYPFGRMCVILIGGILDYSQ